jgi:hypothetical protein
MKKLIIIIVMLVVGNSYGQTTLFEKPRYLKHATLMCPIDITKSYHKEGLIGANRLTINILPDTIFVKVDGKSKKEKVEVQKILKDTILVKNILIEKGYAFDVVQQIGSFSIIKFWNLSKSTGKGLFESITFKKDTIIKSPLNLNQDYKSLNIDGLSASNGNEKIDLSKNYYIVPTKTLSNNSTEFENKKGLWNIGLLVLPIKIRPFATESGQFDFTSGFSVGTTFAWTVHHNWKTNFTHNFIIYAGISSYKADESKIKEVREDYTIATFSPALGWIWEKNNVQLGILMGVDFPSGNLQQNWVYRNKPWFGLGVGIAMFKINSDTQTKSGENK